MTKQITAEAIYSQLVKSLPPSERLKLATLILNDIPPQALVDYSAECTKEAMRDAALYSFRRAAQSFGEEAEDA